MNAIAPAHCAMGCTLLCVKDGILGLNIRPGLLRFIQQRHPAVTVESWICNACLTQAQADYVEAALQEEVTEITKLERDVLTSLQEHEVISMRPTAATDSAPETFGDRLSDRIAELGGSWMFILAFGGFLLLWVVVNTVLLSAKPVDPYPFIFLNLLLSCLAAIQAPLIMMSQNRQEARDRQRAEQDYKVNLKAELEIRHLHEKLDHLLIQHNQRLLEIQQIQTDLLRELVANKR